MPIIKQAIKRVKQSERNRSRHLQVKRAIKQDMRALSDAIEAKNANDVTKTLREAVSEIDRAVKKGTLHKNTAARRKSTITKAANVIAGGKPKAKAGTKSAKTPTKVSKPVANKASAKKPVVKKVK